MKKTNKFVLRACSALLCCLLPITSIGCGKTTSTDATQVVESNDSVEATTESVSEANGSEEANAELITETSDSEKEPADTKTGEANASEYVWDFDDLVLCTGR